jgi:hypothetical protein
MTSTPRNKFSAIPAGLALGGGFLFWFSSFNLSPPSYGSVLTVINYQIAMCTIFSFFSSLSVDYPNLFLLAAGGLFAGIPFSIVQTDQFFGFLSYFFDSSELLKPKVGLILVVIGSFLSLFVGLYGLLKRYGALPQSPIPFVLSLIPFTLNLVGSILLFVVWKKGESGSEAVFLETIQAVLVSAFFFVAFLFECRPLHHICLYVCGGLIATHLQYALTGSLFERYGGHSFRVVIAVSFVWSSLVLFGLGTLIYIGYIDKDQHRAQQEVRNLVVGNTATLPPYNLLADTAVVKI